MGQIETSLKRQREMKLRMEDMKMQKSITNMVEVESSHALAGRRLKKLEDIDLQDLVETIRDRLDPLHTTSNFNKRRYTDTA